MWALQLAALFQNVAHICSYYTYFSYYCSFFPLFSSFSSFSREGIIEGIIGYRIGI